MSCFGNSLIVRGKLVLLTGTSGCSKIRGAMRTSLAWVILFTACLAQAAEYQNGILVSFRDVRTGSSCSGSVNAKADDDGNVNGNSNSSCSDTTERDYTVKIGDQLMVITPALTKKRSGFAIATLGWSEIPRKGSVLRDQLPGAHFMVRSDSSGMYVKVDKKESKFRIVAAN